jgi:hypothetical protein
MKTLLLYSDKVYEKMLESFLISRRYANLEHIPVIYYSIGFDSDLEYPNLTKVRWEFDERKAGLNLNYYKPDIILDSFKYSNEICYMDTDILLSKRFNIDSLFDNELDYPMCCKGPLQFVWYWSVDGNGVQTKIDEWNLMNYYGVKERTSNYLWSSMMACSEKCIDFLEEWQSINNNSYLLKRDLHFFPFKDETALNVVFWKRGCTKSLDLLFFNTLKFRSFLKVETQNDFSFKSDKFDSFYLLDDDIYEVCENSEMVQFYHGMKISEDLDRTVEWMIEMT